MSRAITRGIEIQVEPEYLPEQSSPDQGLWVHAYEVTISNHSDQTVQLISRHWVITNAHGTEEHVRGAGVVGHQPILRPGEGFRYSSGAPLDTPVGTMHGTYQMVTEGGERFDAVIAPFTLAEPYALN